MMRRGPKSRRTPLHIQVAHDGDQVVEELVVSVAAGVEVDGVAPIAFGAAEPVQKAFFNLKVYICYGEKGRAHTFLDGSDDASQDIALQAGVAFDSLLLKKVASF